MNKEDSLLSAIKSGDVDEVRGLLEQDRYLVNCTDTDGLTPLHYACGKGNLEMVRMLISEFGADSNARALNNITPIRTAAVNGKEEVTLTLIKEFGCDPTVKGQNGRSLLHNACQSGNVSLIQTLIRDFKADISARDDDKNLPINVAAFSGKEEMVLTLIKEFGCDPTVKGQNGRSLLHNACQSGNVSLIQTLIRDFKADISARDDDKNLPINVAAFSGKEEVVLTLIKEFGSDPTVKGQYGWSLLHNACYSGNVSLIQTLIRDFKADISARDDNKNLPINVAAFSGKEEVVLTLIKEFGCDPTVKGQNGRSLLHNACQSGNVSLIQTLIRDFKADISARDDDKNLPINVAAFSGKEEVVLTLIKEFGCDPTVKGRYGKSLLHNACYSGNVSLIQTLIRDFKADISARDDDKNLPINVAAFSGKEEVVLTLIKEFGCDPTVKGQNGRSLLHNACQSGNVSLIQTLIRDFKADISARDDGKEYPINVAAFSGKEEVVLTLIKEFGCDPTVKGRYGRSLLHNACQSGNVSLIQTLIRDFKADISARDDGKEYPINVAAFSGKEEVVLTLIKEFGCDPTVKGRYGRSLLHNACQSGNVSLIQTLIRDFKADISARDDDKNLPINVAAFSGKEEVVLTLIKEFGCDPTVKGRYGKSLLHNACYSGNVSLIQTLIRDFKADISARDDDKNLPINVAAFSGKEEVVLTLIKEFGCDPTVKGRYGRSLLHNACQSGNVSLIQTLIRDFKADISARDDGKEYPINVAAFSGKEEVVLTLIKEFGCDPTVKGRYGRSLLHNACYSGNVSLVQTLMDTGYAISALVVDDDGDTPLHTCASQGYSECVKAVLKMNVPVLVKNKSGKSPLTVARGESKKVLETHIAENKDNIHRYYKVIQQNAEKKYAGAEHLTRLFVIGNCGSGKSSLIETLKREGFFDKFKKLTESNVPPHTAGIIPHTHNSKHYGRVLFYDFAGETEYYSSHAAILENIAKSKKGDNIFALVVNLNESSDSVSNILHYWVLFIQQLNFDTKRSSLIIIGSHLDVVSKETSEMHETTFREFLSVINSTGVMRSAIYLLLDCCQPQSKQIKEFQNHISGLITNSPRYQLSLQASTLLGMLETDFRQVAACTVQTVLDHIEVTGIALPKDITALLPILHELHELGLLFFLPGTSAGESSLVVLNITQLTNQVHKLLFSPQATQNLKKYIKKEDMASFNVGILPEKVLEKILPKHITKECLIHLQYCQKIRHSDVGTFPAITHHTQQSFLFFPALCSSDKSDTPLVTHPADLSYGIGWLARCYDDPSAYFSPRFAHVLHLRLVFEFTLSAPIQNLTSSTTSDLHLQRRCTMWRTGVHWLMEEGVECRVELVSKSQIIKGVLVTVKTIRDARLVDNCIHVFNNIIRCVMQAKAEFCHSIRPKFFLLDSPATPACLNDDYLFAMSDVERVLMSPKRKQWVLSISGKQQMERSKLVNLLQLSHWNNLFPIHFVPVHDYLQEVVQELQNLGLSLDIPWRKLQEIKKNCATVEEQRMELVSVWMSSSDKPPCWWHLVQALKKTTHKTLAETIAAENSKLVHS